VKKGAGEGRDEGVGRGGDGADGLEGWGEGVDSGEEGGGDEGAGLEKLRLVGVRWKELKRKGKEMLTES
jgi:hypothetical protein